MSEQDNPGNNDQDDIDALLEDVLGDMDAAPDAAGEKADDFDIDDILQAAGGEENGGQADDFDIDDILAASGQAEREPADDFDIDDILADNAGEAPAAEVAPTTAAGDENDAPAPESTHDDPGGTSTDTGTAPSGTGHVDLLSETILPETEEPEPPRAPAVDDAAETTASQADIDDLLDKAPAGTGAEPEPEPEAATPAEDLDVDDILAGFEQEVTSQEDADDVPDSIDLAAGPEPESASGAQADDAAPDQDNEPAAQSPADATGPAPETAEPATASDAGETGGENSNDGLETLDIGLATAGIMEEPEPSPAANTPEPPVEVQDPAAEAVNEDGTGPEPAGETEIPTLTEVVMTGEEYRAATAGETDDLQLLLGEAASQAVHQALRDAAPAIERAVLEQLQNRLPALLEQAMQQAPRRDA